MKRSNRLVLLIGIFLAVIAFIGILFISNNGGGGGQGAAPTTPTQLPTVFAKADIPLGTELTQDTVGTLLEVKQQPVGARDASAISDPSLLIGRIVRSDVKAGKQLTAADFGATAGTCQSPAPPPGLRAVAIQVDQLSGVGTAIQPGDWVDAVLGITGDKFPVVTVNPTDQSLQAVAGVNGTSVKVVIQGIQVLCTLLPPPPAPAQNQAPTPAPSPGSAQTVGLTGQQEIVIVAVSAQQSEIVKYAQLDGSTTLALRSPKDFVDPTTNQPVVPVPDKTSGITLKVLVDSYGVLPPQVVESVLPAGAKP